MTKPFLLLQSRPEAEASDDEYQAFLKFGGLEADQLVRLRLERGDEPAVNLDDYTGIIMGGGPANFAYPPEEKSPEQLQFEDYIMPLLRRIIAEDKPFLGTCLGVGALVTALGGRTDFDHGEPVCAVDINLTPEAQDDPLLVGLPASFRGFVGHKEGTDTAPPNSVVLARSVACIQLLRARQNVYSAQFHPELDADGLALRIDIYRHAGYFSPEEAQDLIDAAYRESRSVTEPVKILRRFVEKYTE